MSAQWFYRRDGQQFGPVSSRKLYRLVQSGEVGADDMLWREGLPGWRRAGESKTLFGTAAAPDKRMRKQRHKPARSRRPAQAKATAALEAAKWIGRRPLLTVVGAGIVISAILAAVLIRFDMSPREEMDAAQPSPDMPAAAAPPRVEPKPMEPAAEKPAPDMQAAIDPEAVAPADDPPPNPADDPATTPADEQLLSEAQPEPSAPPAPLLRPEMRGPDDDF